MYYNYDILTSGDRRAIRAKIKAERSFGTIDCRTARRRLRVALKNGDEMFPSIAKPGKYISDMFTSSRAYKTAYSFKRYEIELSNAAAWDY